MLFMQSGNPLASLRWLIGAIAISIGVGGCAFVPHPLTDAERTAEASQDMADVFSAQEPLRHALTLEEAFARAMAYNLDERVKLMERHVAQRDSRSASWTAAENDRVRRRSTRTNDLASRSVNVLAGEHRWRLRLDRSRL